jgi:hypothetical protein
MGARKSIQKRRRILRLLIRRRSRQQEQEAANKVVDQGQGGHQHEDLRNATAQSWEENKAEKALLRGLGCKGIFPQKD